MMDIRTTELTVISEEEARTRFNSLAAGQSAELSAYYDGNFIVFVDNEGSKEAIEMIERIEFSYFHLSTQPGLIDRYQSFDNLMKAMFSDPVILDTKRELYLIQVAVQ